MLSDLEPTSFDVDVPDLFVEYEPIPADRRPRGVRVTTEQVAGLIPAEPLKTVTFVTRYSWDFTDK